MQIPSAGNAPGMKTAPRPDIRSERNKAKRTTSARGHTMSPIIRTCARRTPWLSLVVLGAATTALAANAAPPVINDDTPTLESLDAWRAHIEPTDDDTRWLNIDWRPTLWQAAEDARRLRKPIVLWAMNGHPMGCT